MKAVILAAGMGQRIRECHTLPKGFIKLNHQTIIESSLEKLWQTGIKKILIVTGYESHHYDALQNRYPNLLTIKNHDFEQTGSLYSLYCAKDWIDEDFLLLESDIIYEQRALSQLLKLSDDNAICLSGTTNAGDEVFVEAQHNYLVKMSKNKNSLLANQIAGEFVGINKLSLSAYHQLIHMIRENNALLRQGHYETDGLVALAEITPIHCHQIPDLIWCEIDDAQHLERAKKIYDRLSSD